VDLVKDTVKLDGDKNVLEPSLSADVDSLDLFAKLTEDCRRERLRRIDAGDQSCKLKFSPLVNTVKKPDASPTGKASTIPPPDLRKKEKEDAWEKKKDSWGKVGNRGGWGNKNRW